VRVRTFRFILPILGLALLIFAGLVFFVNKETVPDLSQGTPVPSPTPNRLAEPTLSPQASQADYGAQAYWLNCLPCHGDKGQGLTDEFRTTYPPEDQNCWKSGCHGKRPYEDGFTIPMLIPAVIGNDALIKFSDAAQLNAYIRVAMPFWKPGSLTEDDVWKITAFLMRENGFWDGTTDLNETNAAQVKILHLSPQQVQIRERGGVIMLVVGAALILLILIYILIKIKNKATIERETL